MEIPVVAGRLVAAVHLAAFVAIDQLQVFPAVVWWPSHSSRKPSSMDLDRSSQ